MYCFRVKSRGLAIKAFGHSANLHSGVPRLARLHVLMIAFSCTVTDQRVIVLVVVLFSASRIHSNNTML